MLHTWEIITITGKRYLHVSKVHNSLTDLMMSALFPVTIEYPSSMRIGLGPSNMSIEIPHHSADVAVFSHAVVIVSGHACPDNFNSANYVTHDYYITAYV